MFLILAALTVFSSSEADIGYVKPFNQSDNVCSNLSCEYLNYYAKNSSLLVDNYTLHFLPGYHNLTVDLIVTNASLLTFLADKMSSSGEVVIRCAHLVGLVFRNIRTLKLKGLKFQYCGTNYSRDTRSGLRFQDVINLTLQDIHVHNGTGYGMVVKNSHGNSSLENCTFLYNTGSSTYTGGNAFIEYSNCSAELSDESTDIVLSIVSSNFSYGSYTGQNHSLHARTLATGLTIILSCNVYLYINNITVSNNNNSLKYGLGGNMFIHFYNEYHYISNHVLINGSRLLGGRAELGAGLGVTFFIKEISKHHNSCNNSLTIANSELSSNTGISGCGMYLEVIIPTVKESCPMGHILLVNTALLHNVAELSHYSFQWNIGAAIFILNGYVRDKLKEVEPFSVSFDNITVQGSETKLLNKTVSASEVSAAVLSSKFVGNFTISNSRIQHNRVSGIALFRSKMLFSGTVQIHNNSGINGGGLVLCEGSYIELSPSTPYSIITFIGNKATFFGGAIYSETQCRDSHPNCFYQFVSMPNCFHEVDHSECFQSHITMENNSAGSAGMDIYGGNVANCYFHRTGLEYRVQSEIFYAIFNVTKNVYGHFSAVSSDPIRVCECSSSHQYNCSQTSVPFHRNVYPGEVIHIPVVVVGQLNGTVSGSVLINGDMPYFINSTNSCTHLPINISHGVSSYKIEVTNTAISKTTKFLQLPNHFNSLTLQVNLSKCPVGFILMEDQCRCDSNHTHSSYCDITRSTTSREYGSWVGYNSIHNHKYVKGIIYFRACPLDYCDEAVRQIPVSDTDIQSDKQCSKHRTGLLCGACKVNFSVAFGNTKCLDCRTIPMLYPLLISFLLAVCGIVFIVTLVALDITVTDGLLAGLLFYANILYTNKELFRFTGTNFLTIVISVLNLDIGLNSCFYNGMDTYAKTWIQLCVPQMLWLFITVIVLLSKKFDIVAKLVGKNSARTLATLIEITFNRTLQACIVIFSCAGLNYPSQNGTTLVRLVWLRDANIDYFQGKHIPLFMVGAILSVFLLLYSVVLLFVQPLQRYSHLYCFRWVNRLKPLIDAYTAPHVIKAKCRFWGGLLLLLRILLSIYMAVNIKNREDNNFAAVAVICILIFALSFVTGGIYKSVWLNLLNGSFLFNLILLSIAMNYLYTKNKSFYFGYPKKHVSNIIVYLSSSIAVLQALIVLVYYISRKLKKCFKEQCCKKYWRRSELSERNTLLDYYQDNTDNPRHFN